MARGARGRQSHLLRLLRKRKRKHKHKPSPRPHNLLNPQCLSSKNKRNLSPSRAS